MLNFDNLLQKECINSKYINRLEIAIIFAMGCFVWISSWILDRWFLSLSFFLLLLLAAVIAFLHFIFFHSFYRLFNEKKYYKNLLLILATVVAIFTAILTLKFTFGVVKTDSTMTFGRVLDKQKKWYTTGPFTPPVEAYLIKVAFKNPEGLHFTIRVSQYFYDRLNVGKRVQINYHIESIIFWEISKRNIVIDSIHSKNFTENFSYIFNKFINLISLIIGLFPLSYTISGKYHLPQAIISFLDKILRNLFV